LMTWRKKGVAGPKIKTYARLKNRILTPKCGEIALPSSLLAAAETTWGVLKRKVR
jgi:hypothetical protein